MTALRPLTPTHHGTLIGCVCPYCGFTTCIVRPDTGMFACGACTAHGTVEELVAAIPGRTPLEEAAVATVMTPQGHNDDTATTPGQHRATPVRATPLLRNLMDAANRLMGPKKRRSITIHALLTEAGLDHGDKAKAIRALKGALNQHNPGTVRIVVDGKNVRSPVFKFTRQRLDRDLAALAAAEEEK